jgi:hypothetical protein
MRTSSATHEAKTITRPTSAPIGILQRKCACGTHTIAGGDCASCGKEKVSGNLQRAAKSAEPVNEVLPVVHDVLRAAGQPLDPDARTFMESRLGHDFSRVRVHTDGRAAQSARAVNALAYTVGHNIVFGAGQYSPQTSTGQRLLAHELTHTIQQQAGVHLGSWMSEAGDPSEREAGDVARLVSEGKSAPLLAASHQPAPVGGLDSRPVIQRQKAGAGLDAPHKAAFNTPAFTGSGVKEGRSRLKQMLLKGTKKPSPLELPSLISRFLSMVIALEKKLEGHATQSWGMIIYGEGDGKGSTATEASKDANIWGSFDFAEFTELMDLIMLAIPETLDYRKKLEHFRDALDPRKIMKDPVKVAEFAQDKFEQVAEIKDTFGAAETKKSAGASVAKRQTGTLEGRQASTGKVKAEAAVTKKTTTTPQPQKVEVERWTSTEITFNQFFMMKYSDGSKRFLITSVWGTREISDPGLTHWEKVQGGSGTVPQASTDKSNVSQPTGQTATSTGQTTTLNSKLDTFIEDLKKDATYGSKVRVTSTVRDAERDARAVLKNQKNDSNYYKIYTDKWEAAILDAIKERDLKIAGDFDAAVSALAAWIVEKPERSPHVVGRAVDFGLAGGDADFRSFIKTEAEKRGFTFIDETSKNHYHVQM